MTDYTELVKALRHCGKDLMPGERCKDSCPYGDIALCLPKLKLDAAAAIEALQAENPIVETVLVDKMRQQTEETVCHCNVKENAELIAKILDDDVDKKVFELPKRGEWIWDDKRCIYVCSVCGSPKVRENMDRQIIKEQAYCYSCGAKMEVQDADT